MEEFVPQGILAMLSPQVDTEAGQQRQQQRTTPSSRHGSASPLNKFRPCSSEDGDEYVDLLKNVYQDQHALNYAQKEKVATQVLKGEYNVSQQFEPERGPGPGDQNRQYDPFRHQAHSQAVLRRHQLTHRLFELTSQPASFHSADPVAKQQQATLRNQQLGRGPQHFVSLGKLNTAVPLFVPPRKEKQKACFPSRTEIVSQQIALDAGKVKQFRGSAGDQKGEYAGQKKREIEVRKKMAAFKEKLYKRLKEKHDPQLTSIMRTLDDSVIFSFIESYRGCTMSVDAILQHIGANVAPCSTATNTDLLQIAVPSQKNVSNGNGYRLVPRLSKSKGAGFRQHVRHAQQQQGGGGGEHDLLVPDSPSERSQQVMQQRLSAEHLLPSMQPEKAVTDEELLRLGARTTSCDRLRGGGGRLGKVQLASTRPPRSLQTRQQQHTNGGGGVQSQDMQVAAVPSLSATNYGGMYVISSYKDQVK